MHRLKRQHHPVNYYQICLLYITSGYQQKNTKRSRSGKASTSASSSSWALRQRQLQEICHRNTRQHKWKQVFIRPTTAPASYSSSSPSWGSTDRPTSPADGGVFLWAPRRHVTSLPGGGGGVFKASLEQSSRPLLLFVVVVGYQSVSRHPRVVVVFCLFSQTMGRRWSRRMGRTQNPRNCYPLHLPHSFISHRAECDPDLGSE